jgi:hypothetical protein
VKTQCQNLNGNPIQTTEVVRFWTPNFVDHLDMFIKHGLHQKSHISGHLLRRPPLVYDPRYLIISLPEIPYTPPVYVRFWPTLHVSVYNHMSNCHLCGRPIAPRHFSSLKCSAFAATAQALFTLGPRFPLPLQFSPSSHRSKNHGGPMPVLSTSTHTCTHTYTHIHTTTIRTQYVSFK